MLWLALYFPELPLEVCAQRCPPAASLALIERGRHGDRVVRCNTPARAGGVRPGQRLQTALALDAALQVCTRDRGRERQALQELALWALQFSSRISFEPSLILLEIGASLRLFGGLQSLLQRVRTEALELGYELQWGVAPTPMAAGLLARELPSRQVSEARELRRALDEVPLERLTRDGKARRLVRDIGLRHIGECLALPRPELARRAGPGLLLLFDRLLGRAPDPRDPWQPPARFAQTVELQAEICQQTALVFPARRLLLSLCGFLRGIGAATQQLLWSLQHRDEQADTRFRQGLLEPGRDPQHLLELFQERIERLSLTAPVIAVRLEVGDCLPFAETSGALFDAPTGPAPGLLERLGSRLGEQRVRGLGTRADHRPEYSSHSVLPGLGQAVHVPRGQLPLWLLPEPRPLAEMGGVPQYGGPLILQGGSRRIESGWWDGQDVARDYYQALSPGGERLWVFRERRSGRWFLHGLFD